MARYKVYFDCVVTVEANNATEAIKQAWLIENIDKNGTFELKDVKREIE